MRDNSAGALNRNNLEQLPRTGPRNKKRKSSEPCSVCIEQRICTATSENERTSKHERLAQYRKAA